MRNNLVFLGPPGSGKGTQAKTLSQKLEIPHISLGDILREQVRQESEIGLKIKEIMTTGKLVPDEITIGLTKTRISQPDCNKGFILDGFPRSAVQAEALDKMMKELGLELTQVIYFDLSQDEVVKRLSGRRSCQKCGAVYHVIYNPPKEDGKCDHDGSDLYQRADDQESAIRTRFEVYHQQTKPLIERYQQAGKLVSISASGSIEEIFAQLMDTVSTSVNKN